MLRFVLTFFLLGTFAGSAQPLTLGVGSAGGPGLVAPYTYCVDSVNGNDANSGSCAIGQQKQNITALPSLASGQSIGLAGDSYWRQELRITADNVVIAAYGPGARPILDASDRLLNAGFTKTSNQDPATGNGGINLSALKGGPWSVTVSIDTNINDALTCNFAGPFVKTPSSGFTSWSTP